MKYKYNGLAINVTIISVLLIMINGLAHNLPAVAVSIFAFFLSVGYFGVKEKK